MIESNKLAAFLDGRLSERERRDAIKELGESPQSYELFIETAEDLYPESHQEHVAQWEEDEAQIKQALKFSKASAVSPLERIRRHIGQFRLQYATVGAVAVLAIMMVPAIRMLRGPDALQLSGEVLVAPITTPASLEALRGEAWDQRSWTVTRGGPTRFVEPELAFRLGVRAVDIQVALALDDRDRAARFCTNMQELLAPISLSEPFSARYADLRTRLSTAEPTDQLVADASTVEHMIDEFLGSRDFTFGKWCGAAELAALARNPDFFQSEHTVRLLEAVERGEIAGGDTVTMRRITDMIRGGVNDREYEELRQLLRELIRANGGG